MTFNLLTALYSAGMVQALIFLVVLLRKEHRSQLSNRILAAILSCIFVILALYTSISQGIPQGFWIGILGTVSWFGLGPLLYLYARAGTVENFRLRKAHLLLFSVPAYNALQYLAHLAGFDFGFYQLFSDFVAYSYAWLFAYLFHSLVFGILAMMQIRRRKVSRAWLLNYFYLLNAMLMASIVFLAIKADANRYYNEIEQYLVVVFDLFVVVLTLGSLKVSPSFTPAKKITAEHKYTNSSLTREELQLLHQRLCEVMDKEKPYLNRKLTLSALAQQATVKENQLSQVFSQLLESGFYDFVSSYRLKELESRLTDPSYQHLKIASLAEDCGFNSKAAFYKAFKEKHGQTPTEYLKSKSD